MSDQSEETLKQEEQQAEASFAAAFNRTRGIEVEVETPSEKKDPDQETETAAGEGTETEPQGKDPQAATPESAPDKGNGRDEERDRLYQRVRTLEGTVGGLRQQLDDARQQLDTSLTKARETETEDGETPSNAEVTEALKSSEKLEAFKKDYPEWAEPVQEQFDLMRAQVRQEIQQEVRQAEERALQRFQAERQAEREAEETERAKEAAQLEMARVEEKHEGWLKTTDSQEFQTWAFEGGPSDEEQREYFSHPFDTKEGQQARADLRYDFAMKYPQWWGDRGARYFSPRADDAIALLDDYTGKNKKDPQQEKRERQEKRLSAAETPRGSPAPVNREPSAQEAFERGYNRARGR